MKKENLFIDEFRNTVQFHSKVGFAANGDLFDGFIEHNLETNEWHIICLTYEDEDAWLEFDQDWGMHGGGATLVEAVANLKIQAQYNMYPLLTMLN